MNYPVQDNIVREAAMATKTSRAGSADSEVGQFAEAVRSARKRHRMTQAELAGLSGTGLRFVSELERGKPTVAMNKVLAVLATLGLRVHIEAGPNA